MPLVSLRRIVPLTGLIDLALLFAEQPSKQTSDRGQSFVGLLESQKVHSVLASGVSWLVSVSRPASMRDPTYKKGSLYSEVGKSTSCLALLARWRR